jgi:glycosyltransferase involved in cell wall biosynthesis
VTPVKTRLAAIVPCYNEERAVASVVHGLRASLPDATIYVYDNNSIDRTVEEARAAGAVVRHEPRRGKGNVLRRAFADVDADAIVLVDGDGTYDVERAAEMVELLFAGPYDQVVGVRREVSEAAYRRGHALGNQFLTGSVRLMFGNQVSDVLSGYRVLSRRFVKSFPALSTEFETETEMAVHALNLRLPTAELETLYRPRPEGSASKLRTFRDGWQILRLIVRLVRRERPALFHGLIAGVLVIIGLALGIPVVAEYLDTGLVPRFPTAILAASIMVMAIVILMVGYVLEGIAHLRQEHARLAYLRYPPPDRS